jgi:hypothetical protein
MTDADRRRIEARKQEARNLILEAKGDRCTRCQRRFAPEQLHMHHRNPAEKLFAISTWTQRPTRSLRTLKAELAKCDPVCLGCHGDEHRDDYRQRARTAPRHSDGRFKAAA